MKRTDDDAALSRGAASDLWRNTLSQISSHFGRLVYLAGLRNPNNGSYEHHGLFMVFGEEEANKAMKKSHTVVFREWLTFSLEQQTRDLEDYIAGTGEDRATVIRHWLKLAPYRNLVPGSAKNVERKLFVADLSAVLELLRNAIGAAGRHPAASPRRSPGR